MATTAERPRPFPAAVTRRAVRLAAGAVLALFVLGLALAWVVGGRLVAPEPRLIGAPPADLPAGVVTIESASGSRLAGWHVPATASRGVVVLLHGIRGSRRSMLPRARWLHGAGYSTLMVDFQAHGESTGRRITLGHLESLDVRAAVGYARARHPGEPVAVIGVSLGAAAGVLAAPLGIDAMVIEGAFPDIETAIRNRVAVRLGPLAPLPAALLVAQIAPRLDVSPSRLRPIDRIGAVGCPLLVIGGSADRRTTAAETRALFMAAREPKSLWLVEGAGHLDLHRARRNAYETRVLAFLDTHLGAHG